MLVAIQDFVKDSFGEPTSDTLDAIEAGEFLIWVQHTPHAILAAVIRGIPPKTLKIAFEKVLERICASRASVLSNFDGDLTPFRTCTEDLAGCFLGDGKTARARIPWPLWVVPACLALLLAFWSYFSLRQARRWQEFVNTLRQEPGIVVTESGRRGGKYILSGLRDPLARDPAVLLKQAGFTASDVDFGWQSYMSMQPPFTGMREFEDLRKRVESRKIYFQLDSSAISSEQLGIVQDTAQEINALLSQAERAGKKIKIEIVARTDSSGSEQRNTTLLGARAAEAAAFLVASGAPPQALSTPSAASRGPLEVGEGERSRAFQRNVSFRVHPAER
jgi:outer membrane protein OmpA-like peptidoglycan-associated protein